MLLHDKWYHVTLRHPMIREGNMGGKGQRVNKKENLPQLCKAELLVLHLQTATTLKRETINRQ